MWGNCYYTSVRYPGRLCQSLKNVLNIGQMSGREKKGNSVSLGHQDKETVDQEALWDWTLGDRAVLLSCESPELLCSAQGCWSERPAQSEECPVVPQAICKQEECQHWPRWPALAPGKSLVIGLHIAHKFLEGKELSPGYPSRLLWEAEGILGETVCFPALPGLEAMQTAVSGRQGRGCHHSWPAELHRPYRKHTINSQKRIWLVSVCHNHEPWRAHGSESAGGTQGLGSWRR